MNNFEFIRHENLPEDPYIKEIAVLNINGLEVLYVRRAKKDGSGMFWAVPSVSFLEERGWEGGQQKKQQPKEAMPYPHGLVKNSQMQQEPEQDLPF